MKFTTYLKQKEDFLPLYELGVQEFIIGLQEISRFGGWKKEELLAFIQEHQANPKDNKMRFLLEWDILMDQPILLKSMAFLQQLPLEFFAAIRVQDLGAYQYLRENYPAIPLHLILENGNHNLKGLLRYGEDGGKQLERVVLSIELPKDILGDYFAAIAALGIETELLILGRILIFYSPRFLLSPFLDERTKALEVREAQGKSEESPHKGFPLIENAHGTFMFNVKDFCLLEYLDELQEMGLNYARVDLRMHPSFPVVKEIIQEILTQNNVENIKSLYGSPLHKGLFVNNRTDILFPKLKNKHLQNSEGQLIGEVIDVVKNKMMAVLIRQNPHKVLIGNQFELLTPQGRNVTFTLQKMMNSLQEDITSVTSHQLIFIPYVPKAIPRSLIRIL